MDDRRAVTNQLPDPEDPGAQSRLRMVEAVVRGRITIPRRKIGFSPRQGLGSQRGARFEPLRTPGFELTEAQGPQRRR